MLSIRTAACALLLLLPLAPAAAAPPVLEDRLAVTWDDRGEIVSLAVPWKLRLGDELDWARPDFDDSLWREIQVPAGSERHEAYAEIAWYRLTVQVGPAGGPPGEARSGLHPPGGRGEDLRLGVTIGKVESAYELWAGGVRIGGAGRLPPEPRTDYDRHGVYPIPAAAIGDDGSLVLALRVWRSPVASSTVGGPTEGPFLLGRLAALTRRELISELPALFLAGIYLLAALFHLALYRRRPELRGYLWFAVVGILFAAYTFLRTQWKYQLIDRFLLLKETEHFLLYLMVPAFIELLWPLLGLRIGPALRAFQGLNLLAGLAAVAIPGFAANVFLLPWWQLGVVGLTAVGLGAILREAWRAHPEARLIAVGSLVAAAAFINDVAVDRGLYVSPRVAAYGFAFLVLSLSISLASRFLRLHRDLDELRRDLERRVEERTRELNEASQAKSRFLAMMSHEIRTPLNGVLGMTGLLLGTDLNPLQREYAELARRSGDVLLSLIDDVLDFSKIEAGKIEIEQHPFRLRQCIEEALDVLAAKAAEKDLDLAYLADRELPWMVQGDALRLRQILVNLVGNAVKFTERGGVLLEAGGVRGGEETAGPSELYFRVTDTGIGISPQQQEGLFQVFRQVDASSTRRHGGSGLGLAISRHLCELMGGRMWVESEVGRGTTFHFTVVAEPREATMDAFLDPRHPELRGRRVLLLESGKWTRRAVADQLCWWGMVPRVAESEAQALDWIRDGEELDAAILGLWGSDSGVPLAREIRRLWEASRRSAVSLPLVAVRRIHFGEEPRLDAADRFAARLFAPVKPDELLGALISIFTRSRPPGRRQPGSPPRPPRGRTAPVPSTADAEAASPLRVLLAEDDEVNRQVALRMLAQLGYRADVAVNGLEVLAAMERRPYDMVLLDVQMPELDGLETARRVRGRWPDSTVRLVAMTANAIQGDREACLAAGMDDYLAKPVELRRLQAALAESEIPEPEREEEAEGTAELPVLDPAALEQLRALDDGDGEFLRSAIDLFLRDAGDKLQSLAAALAEGDAGAVEHLAHSLKSSAGHLGGRRMAAPCFELERAGREGALEGGGELLRSIDTELERLGAALEAERPA